MRHLLLILCLACVGCGSSSPFDYVEASGQVTYDDGTPIPGVEVLFSAQDAPQVEGAHPRPALAQTDAEGNFNCVTSYKYCDGLIPGRHKVTIRQVKDNQGRSLIPVDYTNVATTPIEVDTENVPFEIKVPKPTR
jgi:hypothetical protein